MNAKFLFGVMSGCLVAAAGVAAQSAPAQQSPSQNPSIASTVERAVTARPKIMLQGCLERSAGSPASTPGATGTSGSGGSFTLTKAESKGPISTAPATAGRPGAPGSNGAPGTTGVNSTGGASASAGQLAVTYRLEAEAGMLTPHIGHKVELSGTVEPRGEGAAQGGTTTVQSGNQSAGGTAIGTPQIFKVEEVKMIAATCN